VTIPSGETVGRLQDLVVRLRGADYPLVTGLVVKVGSGLVFLASGELSQLAETGVVLAAARLDVRSFERRDGEVLLRADILGHRLIDVAEAELIRAYDIELAAGPDGLAVTCLDTRRPARLFGLLGQGAGHPCRDWKAFEPLIGHPATARLRGGSMRTRKLKAAQIADLLEEASGTEGRDIMEQVHADPELEADVFEELDPDTASRLFADRSNAEVADVLTRMRADDAADALADLPQQRRQQILDAMPPAHRTKVLTLLGFNPASAGGLMNVDALTVPVEATVTMALDAVAHAHSLQPEALSTVHAVDDQGRLRGVISLVVLVQTDPHASVETVLDTDPVRVAPNTDIVDVALLMADYNLATVPVVDDQDKLLGLITFDDVLESTIPDDWRRREPPSHPGRRAEPEEFSSPLPER
jgi:CBS domain-containing protein